jgi:hypothetical protein
MRLLFRRFRREAPHAGGFLSTAISCGASCISRSAGERAKSRERERKDSGVSPDYDTHSTLSRPRKPSTAVRPSAALKSGSWVSPENDTAQHAHAHNKSSAVEKKNSSDCNATQHATKRKRERLKAV